MQKVRGSIVRKADVSGKNILIEHRSAEETPHLLLLHGIAWRGENVAPAGEHHAGDATVVRREECQMSFSERKFEVRAAQLDLIFRFELVHGRGIGAQRI